MVSSIPINNSISTSLQAAIEANQADQVISVLKKQGELAGGSLPNGEMPLHYAIRKGDSSLVKRMLEEIRFDVHAKDGQSLSPTDHASLTKDPKMIATILGHQIGKSFKIVQKNPLKEEQLRLIETICSEEPFADSSMNEMQKAVLSGDLAAIEKGIQEETPLDVQTPDQKSLLHLAAMGGHLDAIKRLLATGQFDLNRVDQKGLRALHYAMVHEGLEGAQTLIAAGSAPVREEDPVSPMNVMLHSAKLRSRERDPLKLTELQLTLFATILASWVSLYCAGQPLVDAAAVMANAVTCVMTLTSLKSMKSALAFGSLFLAGAIPGFDRIYQGWKIYAVGKNAIYGIKACWTNALVETYRPLRNALIHVVNGLYVLHPVMKAADDAAQSIVDANNRRIGEMEQLLNASFNKERITPKPQIVDVKPPAPNHQKGAAMYRLINSLRKFF